VNCFNLLGASLPWGGVKDSGFGKDTVATLLDSLTN